MQRATIMCAIKCLPPQTISERNGMLAILSNTCFGQDLKELKDFMARYSMYFKKNDKLDGMPVISLFLQSGARSELADCIKYLVEVYKFNLNQLDSKGRTPLDCLVGKNSWVHGGLPPERKINLYDAVTFILTHGGVAKTERENVISFLESNSVMSRKVFENFEEAGQEFLAEKLKRFKILKKQERVQSLKNGTLHAKVKA